MVLMNKLQLAPLRKVKSVDLMAIATVVHVQFNLAFASQDINGTTLRSPVWIPTSASSTCTIACHQPNASTRQGRIDVSVLPSWGGPLMVKAAKTLMNANTQMCVTDKLRATITQVDFTADVIWAGEDKGLILYVSTSMNVRKRLTSNIYFCVMLTFALCC